MLKKLCPLLLVVLLLPACEQKLPEHKATVYVFGTLVEVVLRGVEEDEANALISELQSDFQKMHKEWHAWKEGGELDRINQAIARGEPITVSDFVRTPIEMAQTFEKSSHGYFNAAIGKILAAWGFHSDELPKGNRPPFEEIAALAETAPRMADVTIDKDGVLTSTNPNVSFDFGGFGKGYALDLAEEKLRAKGVEHAVLNAGGDINTLGTHGQRNWKMAIRHPFVKWDVIAYVELEADEELYTSGNYERYREHEGIRYAHILHPDTGMAVDHIVSASVIAPNGALADAAATALTVAGPKNWYQVAKSMGIHYVLLIDEDGTFYGNPAMLKRIVLPDGSKPTIVESPAL